jgi:hypothetical protein
MTTTWDDLRWFIVFNGIADRWLWNFDADGWRLRYEDPANGTLGILPEDNGPPVTLQDALWLADALAYDHDAPVGVSPAMDGILPHATPRDPEAVTPAQPIHPFDDPGTLFYWQRLNDAFAVAAELRFNGSYVIRYNSEDTGSPGTDFSERFRGREQWVGLYAMATRQADLLSEYLCLYRVLEAADSSNGMTFAARVLPHLADVDFGVLRVVGLDLSYRRRALDELADLPNRGVADPAGHLYGIRNSLAHGKSDPLSGVGTDRFASAARALPIVKLLARIAIG